MNIDVYMNKKVNCLTLYSLTHTLIIKHSYNTVNSLLPPLPLKLLPPTIASVIMVHTSTLFVPTITSPIPLPMLALTRHFLIQSLS